jgi:flagellar FliL protein
MADAVETLDPPPRKGGKLALIVGLVLGLAGAGAGFWASFSGLLAGGATQSAPAPEALPAIAFIPIDPILIAIPQQDRSRTLRFSAQIEVNLAYQKDVQLLLPRVIDLLNGYLRAVDPGELEKPSSLFTLRGQMLRRIQLVTGEGRVRDLLITEFVLN